MVISTVKQYDMQDMWYVSRFRCQKSLVRAAHNCVASIVLYATVHRIFRLFFPFMARKSILILHCHSYKNFLFSIQPFYALLQNLKRI